MGDLPTGIVTFLFTDLEGSTRLWQEHPEAMKAALARHDDILRQAVDANGGHVVKSTGDGLHAVFAFAAEAVNAAAVAQQGLEAERWSTTGPLRVRMGIYTGEAESRAGDYYGNAVNVAARLMAAAHGGQAVASQTTADLVDGTVDDIELLDLGTHRLRGLAQPERVFQLVVPGCPVAFPAIRSLDSVLQRESLDVTLPDRVTDQPALTFVGRHAELDRLQHELKDAAATSRRHVAFVSGEAGIGKTSVVFEMAQRAHADGAVVLYGRCEEFGSPYGPWVEALSHLVREAPEELLAWHVANRGGELARLVPDLRARISGVPSPASTDPEAERYLLYGAVASLLQLTSTFAPLVLVIDDLHWIDGPSLDLLRHVISAVGPSRLLIIGTYRSTDLGSDHPLIDLLAALHRETGVERIDMRGFDDATVVELVAGAAGHDLGSYGVALAHALYRDTDGNPFFVSEILRHLAESGRVQQHDDGRWTADPTFLDEISLPTSVREVVERRVARLGSGAQRVLTTAAVIGQDFDLSLLALVTEQAEDTLLDVLDQALSAAILINPGRDRFSFAHALIGHTLAQSLGSTRRARLHRRVAEALEDLYGADPGEHIGELARHWAQAVVPEEATKALEYARRAGEHALAALAPDEAIRWFSDALEHAEHLRSPRDSLRCELLVALGTAQRQAGQPSYRGTLLSAARLARHLDAIDLLVQAALTSHRDLFATVGEVDGEVVEILEAALDAVGAEDSADRARLLAILANELIYAGDLPRRRALVEEAKAIAGRLGDPATKLAVLLHSYQAVWIPETLAERLGDTREAVTLADASGDPLSRWHASANRWACALEAGDLAEVERGLTQEEELAEALGQPTLRWITTYNRACREWLAGDLESSDAKAEEAFHIGAGSGQPDALLIYSGQIMALRWAQGRFGELTEAAAEVAANPALPVLSAIAAFIYAGTDHVEDARDLLAQARNFELEVDSNWLMTLALWAQVASRLDDAACAETLYEHLSPYAEQVVYNGPTIEGPVADALGGLAAVLGRFDAADEHFTDAERINTALDAPFLLAHSRLGHALALARSPSGDDGRAQGLAQQVLGPAREHGFAGLERDADELLRQLRQSD
jgi:class 3 adenylate cyclase